MAKASGNVIKWIWLRDAKERATDRYQSAQRSEECIREWLESGRLRWRCVDPANRSGDPTFFQDREFVAENRPGDEFFVVRPRYVEINFDESSAVRFAPGGKIYGIQVALNDLEELLPPEQIADQESPSATKAWVAAEVDRMKDKGELSKYRGTTALAKELERRRNKAADTNKSIKPVRWPYIKNILYELDLTSIVKRI
jgi:hypothetical protein